MEYFDKLKAKLEMLDEKQFYTYILGALGVLLLFILLVSFYYHRSASSLKRQLEELNSMRSGTVKQILTRADRIKKQKEKLDELLKEDPGFILTEYLNTVLAQSNISDRKEVLAPRYKEIDDTYTEHILDFTLNDINMKQLVEFLVNIENNRRVYTKKLEITKTTRNSLEVRITIATLFPKAA